MVTIEDRGTKVSKSKPKLLFSSLFIFVAVVSSRILLFSGSPRSPRPAVDEAKFATKNMDHCVLRELVFCRYPPSIKSARSKIYFPAVGSSSYDILLFGCSLEIGSCWD